MFSRIWKLQLYSSATSEKSSPPSDIKTSSSSFNEQELNSIKDLKNKINQLVVQFGQLYLSKNQIEEKERLLKSELNILEEQEKTIAKELTNKYGKGSIDLETGTFTPSA